MASLLYSLIAVALLLSVHPHAIEPQSFNKDSPEDPDNTPKNPDNTFLPETDNTYGLYRQYPAVGETQNDFNPNLPKNYNPVAYVTQPDDFNSPTFSDKESYYAVDETEELDENPETETSGNRYASGGYTQGLSSTSLRGGGGGGTGFERFYVGDSVAQGMSDTRVVENGRYFYDVNTGRFNRNHPYEVMKEGAGGRRYFVGNRRSYANAAESGEGEGNWP